VPDDEPAGPSILISEVLADPAPGAAGDHNGDGERDARADEYVELVNTTDGLVDVTGWTLSDNVSTRFVVEERTVLEPGQYLVVFGGGDVSAVEADHVLVADGLYLNNGGDALTLHDDDGEVVDRVRYGSQGGEDRAMNRAGDELATTESATPGRANQ
jgi:hypothetical protein